MVSNVVISNATRWIAAITGCVTAVTGLAVLTLLSPVVSGCLIVGAVVVRRYPRYGRDLMWFGAGVVSLWAIPVGMGILRLSLSGGTDPRVVAAAAVSVFLVVCCDAALLTDAFKSRQTLHVGTRHTNSD